MKFIFEAEKNQRIDKYLATLKLDDIVSRSQIEKLIQQDKVLVNGLPVIKSYNLEVGDEIEVFPVIKEEYSLEPQDLPLQVLYEDQYLAVVNKPAGMVVHPGTNNPDKTLINAAMYHFDGHLSRLDTPRPGIVHRLDKDTTGVILVAKNDEVHLHLKNQFKEKTIEKYYKAIVVGNPNDNHQTIDLPVGRHKTDRIRMAVNKAGRNAVTHFTVNKRYEYFTYLDIQIETGRTHQIRVHLSHINYPILGDNLYNNPRRTMNSIPLHFQKKTENLLKKTLHRQALHAYRIRFDHPILEKRIEVIAPLAQDFQNTLSWLDKHFIEV